jgi:hypothetical protein
LEKNFGSFLESSVRWQLLVGWEAFGVSGGKAIVDGNGDFSRFRQVKAPFAIRSRAR